MAIGRFDIARLFGKLPYFPGQDRIIRALYGPDQVFTGKYPAVTRLVNVEGATFSCSTNSYLEWAIAVKGGEERGLLKFFLELCRVNNFDQFFDVGSNIGYFALPISQYVRTTCFEPYPLNYNTLKKNISLNPHRNIVSLPVGLSDACGEIEIHLLNEQGNFGLATMSPPVEGNKTTTEVVDTVVFDKNFAFDNKRLLFKIDVEGHELKALEGMKATLAKNLCCIYVETEEHKVPEFLKHLGYSVNSIHHNLFRDVRQTQSFATGGQGHLIASNFPINLQK